MHIAIQCIHMYREFGLLSSPLISILSCCVCNNVGASRVVVGYSQISTLASSIMQCRCGLISEQVTVYNKHLLASLCLAITLYPHTQTQRAVQCTTKVFVTSLLTCTVRLCRRIVSHVPKNAPTPLNPERKNSGI